MKPSSLRNCASSSSKPKASTVYGATLLTRLTPTGITARPWSSTIQRPWVCMRDTAKAGWVKLAISVAATRPQIARADTGRIETQCMETSSLLLLCISFCFISFLPFIAVLPAIRPIIPPTIINTENAHDIDVLLSNFLVYICVRKISDYQSHFYSSVKVVNQHCKISHGNNHAACSKVYRFKKCGMLFPAVFIKDQKPSVKISSLLIFKNFFLGILFKKE